jgi:glutaredoxin
VTYVNVRADAMHLARMLQLSGGKRQVPVIVDHGAVTVGYGGT